MSLFGALDAPSLKILDGINSIIRSVRPLNSRQQQQLPLEIKKLFHRLADERSTRRAGYLNEPASLTAYVHYYYWWNLVRLTRLFAGLDAESFCIGENGVCLDIGSGPLTVPAALWLSHPELRARKMTWYCLDRSRAALSLGEELFLAIAARTMNAPSGVVTEPWTIVRIQGEAGIPIRKKAQFVVAANVFNEITQTANRPIDQLAQSAAAMLASYTAADTISAAGENILATASPSAILLVEPGVPPGARFLSLVRSALVQKNWQIQSPCPHTGTCPMDGSHAHSGGKWCHFTFSTTDAPKPLRDLSDSVGLPKDRAALSFLLLNSSAPVNVTAPKALDIRIASDPIALPGNRTGFYGCSKLGLTLLECAAGAIPHEVCSGALVSVPMPEKTPPVDGKSGAVRIMLKD
jgi:hypothetical protein